MVAGFRLTYEEWEGLDDDSRSLLLATFIESTQRADESYESYELSIE